MNPMSSGLLVTDNKISVKLDVVVKLVHNNTMFVDIAKLKYPQVPVPPGKPFVPQFEMTRFPLLE